MAGVLSFTLGLETSNFLRGLGMASGQIISMAGLMDGLGKIARGTWGAIERGGALKDLSNRTGESVGNLYQLEEGFKQVGLGADAVGPMISRLQRALAGVDESGNKTDRLFSSLGLNLEQLRGMDAPARFEALANALSKLGGDQAAGVAAKLFGREGAANFLQLARDYEDFQKSLQDTSKIASIINRTADDFDKIGDTIQSLKTQLGGMFAGIAEGVAPALQKILDWFNSQDWVGIGTRIGNELTIAFQAIDLGRFGEYFTLVMQSAVQDTMNFMMRKIMEFQQWTSGPSFNGDFMPVAKGVGAGVLGLWDEIGAQLGVPGARELSDKRFDQAYSAFEGAGIADGILSSASDAFQKGIEGAPNEFAERLKGLREEMLKSAEDMRQFSTEVNPKGIGTDFRLGKMNKPDASAFEKMGFVMNDGRGATDYARSTSENTKRLVELTGKLLKKRPDLADINWGNVA